MEMTERRKHTVYAMPKPSSSSRKSSYDVLSAAARSGAAGLPTSTTSGQLHDRTLSGLTVVRERPCEPSIYYGSIIGHERSVVFLCPRRRLRPSSRPPHGSPSLCRWLPVGRRRSTDLAASTCAALFRPRE